ncbi:hypothetical protein QBC47DRAFT_429300 [Echria macrotheca]|uniref:Uncharacterized protein n=1 Tax=Echria macrotheca TaxID=438768 RepID=A0AAJ0B8Z8_9PEZI|nr:hypothetical protein QBC47DRAFT_429300 [Echria macrotheca]
MQFLVTAAVFLLSSLTATAAPSAAPLGRSEVLESRQTTCNPAPTPEQLIDNINGWQVDINNVNSFLNAFPTINNTLDLQNGAVTALINASNEPTRLAFLAQQCGACGSTACDAQFQGAVSALMDMFPKVPTDLSNIANLMNVQGNVDEINQVRCCVVLPSAQTLFTKTVASLKVTGVTTFVRLANACAAIRC